MTARAENVFVNIQRKKAKTLELDSQQDVFCVLADNRCELADYFGCVGLECLEFLVKRVLSYELLKRMCL